jgi:fructose-specific phosphotransferase system IIC component
MFENINKGLEEFKSTPGAVLVDVREPDEFASGHIPGAVNLPLSGIQNVSFSKDTVMFIYCLRGSRSMRAVGILKKMGYQNVKSIGGITFNFMLPVFAGFMAYGIAGEDAFMAGFVGGYMTIDSNSGFIGAMIAGFAAGVFANEIQRFTHHLPVFVRKAAPIVVYPVFNLLLMQAVSWVIISPLSRALGALFTALLDTALDGSPVSAGALGALMMATDMGGIINKVAYNYAVAGLSDGKTVFMASVMVGGMVPPTGIFLSMLLFRRRFTRDQKDRGSLTLFMGLSFITEGALPYVFTDVTRVIPSCMVGSAVAGALSSLFGCALPAPHGGIFVLPVMTHPLPFLLSLAAGSAVTAVMLGLTKKVPRENLPKKTI